jgi:hypothetical protein
LAPDAAPEVVRAIESATGASVTVWPHEPAAGPASSPTPVPDAAALAAAFDGVAARRVLVPAGPGDRFEVVQLAD